MGRKGQEQNVHCHGTIGRLGIVQVCVRSCNEVRFHHHHIHPKAQALKLLQKFAILRQEELRPTVLLDYKVDVK